MLKPSRASDSRVECSDKYPKLSTTPQPNCKAPEMYILQQSWVCDSDKSPLVAWLPWASLLTDQWEPPHLQLHHCQHHRHHHHHHCRHRHHHHLCRRHRPPPSPTHHHPHTFPHPWLICENLTLIAALCDPSENEGSSRYLSDLACYFKSVGIEGPKKISV